MSVLLCIGTVLRGKFSIYYSVFSILSVLVSLNSSIHSFAHCGRFFCPQQPFGGGEYFDCFVVFFNRLLGAEGNQREVTAVELFGTSQQGVDFALSRLFGSDVVTNLYQLLHDAVLRH